MSRLSARHTIESSVDRAKPQNWLNGTKPNAYKGNRCHYASNWLTRTAAAVFGLVFTETTSPCFPPLYDVVSHPGTGRLLQLNTGTYYFLIYKLLSTCSPFSQGSTKKKKRTHTHFFFREPGRGGGYTKTKFLNSWEKCHFLDSYRNANAPIYFCFWPF